MKTIKNNQSGFSAVELILVIVVIGLLAGLGYLFYKNQKKTPVNTTEISKSTTSASTIPSPTVAKITELGVQFEVTDSLKDITYKVVNVDYGYLGSLPTAYLSTKSLNTAENGKCDISSVTAGSSKVPPLGFLTKTPGQYPASANADNSTGTLIKQFPGYYIAYRNAGMACFSETSNTATVTKLNTQLSTDLKGLTEIK